MIGKFHDAPIVVQVNTFHNVGHSFRSWDDGKFDAQSYLFLCILHSVDEFIGQLRAHKVALQHCVCVSPELNVISSFLFIWSFISLTSNVLWCDFVIYD